VLPWHNPGRVAEDVNMLYAFLGPNRNIVCGVGRGLGRREYAGLGIDQNEARGRFDESLQVLKQLLGTGKCDFDGEFFKIHGLRLRPQPEKDLSANLWCAGGTAETVQIIAKNNVRPLTIPTTSLDISLAGMRRYAAIRRDAGYTPSHTKLALWTYVAETASEAEQGARHPEALRESLTFAPDVGRRGAQLLPSSPGAGHNQDGFFYALLRKPLTGRP
jgi:alkanesulfonate monooxygenase SsuD/methylene tetrahydromethanopterin reductase-like flavin-dependent oxidoreductase (luciferase family)